MTTIGLEIHLQLSTKTKAFCGCVNEFGKEPNTAVCPVCLGLPGSLPVLNKEYFYRAIKVALSLNCTVSGRMRFDRKNYFYPDLPKNYQISQYDMPLSNKGYLDIVTAQGLKRIGITRVHMEEDAGKLIHDENGVFSLIDLNRTGTPLLEIVSEPDISSPEEAHLYLKNLKSLLEYLDVSDCNMEEGSLRCDANISIRQKQQKELGTKVELKNMNSFKGVKRALEYEQKRQLETISAGEEIVQETRLWNEDKKRTEPMRTKEEAHDYRYFPDPDLADFTISQDIVEKIRESLPEMPQVKCSRFKNEYNLSEYDASVLIMDKCMSDFFEHCVKLYAQPKSIANWLIGELQSYLNEHNSEFKFLSITPLHLTGMIGLIDKGVISNKMAKGILVEILSTGKTAENIVKEKGLSQLTDQSAIQELAYEVLKENPKVKDDYISGKRNALGFLVGQLMKKTQGKANPVVANQMLKYIIEKDKT
ncbi:MAG: Asp-tRNA(Asn)/Glu-tRNA(Gln) amidotransferase subunit GatB [Dehalococcoidia bacterium]|nr:MAG: Asp-tRNA(Asn)/Glu-tRNA(Gln) amidotransferase subunit GatB [Dehalococcoidia bacterium]